MTPTLFESTYSQIEASRQWREQPPYVVACGYLGMAELLTSHTAWVSLPTKHRDLINRVQELTRWSFREIGDVLGTSHTTVGKLMNGAEPSARSQEAVDRLEPLLDVLSRLSAIVPTDSALTGALKGTTDAGRRPLSLLVDGEWSQAYLAALDVINGPRPARPRIRVMASRDRATRELG